MAGIRPRGIAPPRRARFRSPIRDAPLHESGVSFDCADAPGTVCQGENLKKRLLNMSSSDKRRFNPNATIQVTLADVQLAEIGSRLEQEELAESARRPRSLPPPVPARAGVTTSPAEAAAPRPHSAAKKIAYGAMLVVLLSGAIVAGLRAGSIARPTQSGAPGGPTGASTSSPAQAVPASEPPSSDVLKLPTVEMH
jgi:hypothetical protein